MMNLSSQKHPKRMGNPRTREFWIARGYKKQPWRGKGTLLMGVRASKNAKRQFNKQQMHCIQLNPVYDLFWKARGFKKGRPTNWRELLTATGYKKEVKYEKYELDDYFIKNSRETTPDPKSWIDIAFPAMGKYSEDLLPEQACDEEDLTDKDEYGNSPTSQQAMEYIGSPTGTNFVENKPFCSEDHQLSSLRSGEHIPTLSARDLPHQDWPPKKGYFSNTLIKEQRLDPSLWTNRFSDHAANREEFLPEKSYYKEESPHRWHSKECSPESSSRKNRELLPEKNYYESNLSPYGQDNYYKEDSSLCRYSRDPSPDPSSRKGRVYPDHLASREEFLPEKSYYKEESPHRWHSKERSPESSSRKNRELLPEKNYYESNLSPYGQDNYYKEDSSHCRYSRDPSPNPSSRKGRVYPDHPASREELLPQQKYEKYYKDGPLNRRHSKERSSDPPAWRRKGYPDRLSNREELQPKRDYGENCLSHIRNNKYRRDDPSHNRRPRSPHQSSSWKYRRSPDRQTYREELRSRRDYSLKNFREDSPPRYRRSREHSPLARDRQNSSRSFYNDRRFQD